MKRWMKEFRAFALKGNVIDMAVGVVVGSAFTSIVNSLVGDVITPLFTLLSPNSAVFESLTVGGTIMIGKFINAVLSDGFRLHVPSGAGFQPADPAGRKGKGRGTGARAQQRRSAFDRDS